ncbi:MAG: A/G-specific adenine glycosylase [Rhizobiaceae bacterium]|nr:A/G-specific adenine glycosylase [Rhizobiaceae bacterium]
MPSPAQSKSTTTAKLLAWYDRHARELPWRVAPAKRAAGVTPDPYCVWLSEIMLQQTTVEAVKPYFRKFLESWPDIASLAAADSDDVMKAWAGLGYYSRARNLKKCADTVATEFGGRFPGTYDALIKLPGIGPYTAAAIAAIAFDRLEPVVDGNVERVITRLFAIATPLPAAKSQIKAQVEEMLSGERPGDFAQAMMDLGATICTPRRPACLTCPLNHECAALESGDPVFYPVKPAKAERPARRGAAFVAVRDDGAVLLQKRPERGLLGGMAEVPTTDWTSRKDGETGISGAPFAANWQRAGTASHVFTHFTLELAVYRADGIEREPEAGGWWSPSEKLAGEALPTVMKKVIEAAIPGATHTKRRQLKSLGRTQ